ncbi:MAG: CheB methylesterase domain-containing protein [Enterobacterales bacterium]|nr:CheB methylesterase domain-containing protein [Enterobacterales bacterium]
MEVVIIGSSTGGPGKLEEILSGLPADFSAPILIAQHMPAKFTAVFAKRVNNNCAINIQELSRATQLEAGTAYIARGDADVKFIKRANKIMASSIPPRSEYIWHPSVELMTQTAGESFSPDSVVAVMLTGMGNDGAEAMYHLNTKGCRTIAESENSAVVYGMPKELVERGGADLILDSCDVAKQLIEWVG